MDYEYQKPIVEALIFAADEPISDGKISSIVEGLSNKQITKIIEELNKEYLENHRSFFITRVAGGFQFNSHAQFEPWLKKLFKGRSKPRLSRASLESLAIIAFKQPITRPEVDTIRGVYSGGVIKNLLERNLIAIAGRANSVGKPLLYNTTGEFLRYFGLNDISALPKPKEIEEILGQSQDQKEISEEIIEALTALEASKDDDTNDAIK